MDVVTPAVRVLNDRYQLEELLGSGGMASVWRARDLRLDRLVAIKELAGAWLADAFALRSFEREARTAAQLAHPNIVAVHDVGMDGNSRYLVMELVDGATVAQLLADGPLSAAGVIAIAAQTCDGLAAAHAARVIHRDIKPANLMITPSGVVKICDFGIARALSGTGVTAPTVAMGTSTYMAPEQARGDHLDARADLYALGATMFTMLAGAPPFRGSQAEVIEQHLTQVPAPLRAHRADVPPPLEALVSRLLAKSPADRPADATEVREWLVGMMLDPSGAVVSMPARGMIEVPNTAVPRRIRPAGRASASISRASTSTRRYAVGRVRALVAVGAVAVALAVSGLAWAVATRPVPPGLPNPPATVQPPTATSVAAPTQVAAQPSTPIKQSRPAAAPTTMPPTSQPPVDPVAAIRMSIQRLVSTGNLNPTKANDLYNNVDAIAKSVDQGNAGAVANAIKAMRDKLTALRTGGQLSASGYDELNGELDVIAAAQT